MKRRALHRRYGHARTGKTVLRTSTYSEAAEAYLTRDYEVDAKVSPSGLRTFYLHGRQVGTQLPHGAIVPAGALRRAEEIHEAKP